jgi:broad specificity phosphatase PhoE
MRVYLIRHGQTGWNTEGRAQGHTDVELDAIGHDQAELVARFFDRRPLHRVLSSDLLRCQQTAIPTATLTENAVELRTELRERTFGVLEGQHYTVLRAYIEGEIRDKGLARWDVRPDKGESLSDVWERVTPIIELIDSSEEDMAIFSHGGTCSILLSRLLRAPLETTLCFRFENASVTELRRRPGGGWQLLRYSDQGHLGIYEDEVD